MAELKSRGLMFVDSRSSANSVAVKVASAADVPWAYNDRFIDTEASRKAIDRRLEEVEDVARKARFAVAIGSPYPVTMERVAVWLEKVERKGFAIAPISALAGKQAAK
jgi:polysaccharide deacetylase 2 family uncharacterized protein YibQ